VEQNKIHLRLPRALRSVDARHCARRSSERDLVTQCIRIALLTASLLAETFGGRWQPQRVIQPKAFACIKARSCNAQPAAGAAAVQYIPSQVPGGGGTGSRSLSPSCQTSRVKGREGIRAADCLPPSPSEFLLSLCRKSHTTSSLHSLPEGACPALQWRSGKQAEMGATKNVQIPGKASRFLRPWRLRGCRRSLQLGCFPRGKIKSQ